MITLAFAQMLFYLFVSLRKYGGEDGIPLYSKSQLVPAVDLFDRTTFYYVCLAILAAFLVLCRRLTRSRFGMVVRGAKDQRAAHEGAGLPAVPLQADGFRDLGLLAPACPACCWRTPPTSSARPIWRGCARAS